MKGKKQPIPPEEELKALRRKVRSQGRELSTLYVELEDAKSIGRMAAFAKVTAGGLDTEVLFGHLVRTKARGPLTLRTIEYLASCWALGVPPVAERVAELRKKRGVAEGKLEDVQRRAYTAGERSAARFLYPLLLSLTEAVSRAWNDAATLNPAPGEEKRREAVLGRLSSLLTALESTTGAVSTMAEPPVE